MADWNSVEYTFTGDTAKLKELHDALKQHIREDIHLGPIINMEDFQKVTAPSEEPRDFYGAIISKLEYKERNGIGILSFEGINNWTDFIPQDRVLAYVGKNLGLRTELNYGSGGRRDPVNTNTRLIGEQKPHPVDSYFSELIRANGERIEGRVHLSVLPESANKSIRFDGGGSTMGMMLSGLSRNGDTLVNSLWLEPDGAVTVSFTFPRYDAPMHCFSPEEQRNIKATYFSMSQKIGKDPRRMTVSGDDSPITVQMKRLVGNGTLDSFGDFHDGLAAVCKNGKYNYVQPDGHLLAQRWFDSATDFRNGKATITRHGIQAEINTQGIVLTVKALDKAVGGVKIH